MAWAVSLEKRCEIIEYYQTYREMSAERVGQVFGVSEKTVLRYVRGAGVDARARRSRVSFLSAATIARIVERYLTGEETAGEVGRVYGVHARTVLRYVRAAGKNYTRQARPGQGTSRAARYRHFKRQKENEGREDRCKESD